MKKIYLVPLCLLNVALDIKTTVINVKDQQISICYSGKMEELVDIIDIVSILDSALDSPLQQLKMHIQNDCFTVTFQELEYGLQYIVNFLQQQSNDPEMVALGRRVNTVINDIQQYKGL